MLSGPAVFDTASTGSLKQETPDAKPMRTAQDKLSELINLRYEDMDGFERPLISVQMGPDNTLAMVDGRATVVFTTRPQALPMAVA